MWGQDTKHLHLNYVKLCQNLCVLFSHLWLFVCLLIFVKHVLCRAPCFYLPVCFWFWVPANTWHWSLWLLLEPEKFHKKTIFCEIFIVVDPNVAFIVLFYWNWIRVFSKSSIFHVWSGNNLWIVKHLDFCLLEKSK